MNEIGLSKVSSRTTVQDGVYEQLRQALMWGRFEPGQVITIPALSTEFGTSHMPVREALRRLAAENGLEIGRGGSARVPVVSLARLDDLCAVRKALEGLATETAATRLTTAEIDACERLAREHEALGHAGEVYTMLRKNQDFHFAIYERAGSEVLPQLIETLWLRFGPYMRMLSDIVARHLGDGVVRPYATFHYQIVEAFRARDGRAAGALMVQDIEATQALLAEMCPD
ncbi:GntR family transcriptional regulator [Segnochrobactrum spirostomi]|uniref:GntR family transcriptional regulator n=1 Tax=Segnochrobactrum spirostomi TaxID=2608987 RepID=A0A6A7Y492_9HYPH|nr:GntR family transcriptional regulator [Segnochrobactrum spirostomi]MQT12572.1 GntR family transcriptional regulator [Segnochrobactrum spirostomi]